MLQLNGENYIIKSDDRGFTNRQKCLFEKLNSVQVCNSTNADPLFEGETNTIKKPEWRKICTDIEPELKDKKIDTKDFKGRQSIFKRPDSPPHHIQRIPDFKRNPHKWKKYSLSDVSPEDMSDKSNTAAAMAFLNEIRRNKSQDVEFMETGEKIVFKKPFIPKTRNISSKVTNDECSGEEGTSCFKGSKRIMPEYVVGAKKKNSPKKKTNEKSNNTAVIKLNHLEEDDDDE